MPCEGNRKPKPGHSGAFIPEHFIPGVAPDALLDVALSQGPAGASGATPGIKWNELNRSAAPLPATNSPESVWRLDGWRPVCACAAMGAGGPGQGWSAGGPTTGDDLELPVQPLRAPVSTRAAHVERSFGRK